MKPTNRDEDDGCIKSSSNCIIWNGKDLECFGICHGDALNKVVYELAKNLCKVLKQLNVSAYDLSCFNLQNCAPKDFTALLQLIIGKICALEGISNPTNPTSGGCPDNCTVNIAPCFYYNDPTTGDQVTTSSLSNYITLLGNNICALISANNQNTQGLQQQGGRLSTVEKQVVALQNAPAAVPSITPSCVLASKSTLITVVLQALETQFCQLRAATGTPDQLFQAIASQPTNLNTSSALGTQGGKMDSIPGWVSEPANVADSLNNAWLTIADLRNAVTNIQVNCCPNPCNGVSVLLQATLPNATTLILFFTGSIPQGLTECNTLGTLFTIADQSGHLLKVTIPVAANLNNPSGFPININGTPLNGADNFTITADICFQNNTAGIKCQSNLEYIFVNTLTCPALSFIAGLTTLAFSFSHGSGTKTYTVSLYDSTGNTVIQSQIFEENNPTTVTGTFSSLTMGTVYKVRLFIQGSNNVVTSCPFVVVSTLPNPCPPPSAVSAVITIP